MDYDEKYHDGKCYNVSPNVFDNEDYIEIGYCFSLEEDNKLHFYNPCLKCDRCFEIIRLLYEKFNIFHPFRKRELLEVVVQCIELNK